MQRAQEKSAFMAQPQQKMHRETSGIDTKQLHIDYGYIGDTRNGFSYNGEAADGIMVIYCNRV